MATIEDLGGREQLRPYLETLDEAGLIGQQLVQQGAIHALETLLKHDLTEQTVQDMLASLRANMLVVEAVSRDKGCKAVFEDEPADAGRALHGGAIATISRLMDGDPAVGTPQGDALTLLAAAVEAYERATLAPPFGNAGVSVAHGQPSRPNPLEAE